MHIPDNPIETLRQLTTKVFNSSLARNSAALYGVQICRKVFPLVSIPYLAYTLGATHWGAVAFVLSLAEIVALIIEFGFNLSATREVSRGRHSPETCRDVMAGVLGAQLLLAFVGIALAALVVPHIELLRQNPMMMAAGLLYALAQGFTPMWAFQGLERLGLAAGFEVGGKALMLAGIFYFVQTPEDGWKILALYAFSSGFSTVAGMGFAARQFGLRLPTPALVSDALRRGWPMFVFRAAESLYGVGNSFLLGLFAPFAVVGYFATAEKISKAVFGLLMPIRDALYPRLAYLAASSEQEAGQLARRGIAVMTLGGALLSTTLYVSAPWLIRILAGPDFVPAVPVLRTLSALPFLLSVTNAVGLQWLIPLGRDKVVNRIIIGGGLLNLALSFTLAPRFGAVGMACSVVAAELFVCTCFVWVVCASTSLWTGFGNLERCSPAVSSGGKF